MAADTAYDFISMACYVIAAILYCGLLGIISQIEYRHKKKKYPLTDEACLERLAKKNGQSEYDVFLAASATWHISDNQAKSDFKAYLRSGIMPYYLRDFVRQHKREVENDDQPHFLFRNNQPPACPG